MDRNLNGQESSNQLMLLECSWESGETLVEIAVFCCFGLGFCFFFPSEMIM